MVFTLQSPLSPYRGIARQHPSTSKRDETSQSVPGYGTGCFIPMYHTLGIVKVIIRLVPTDGYPTRDHRGPDYIVSHFRGPRPR